MRSLDFKEFDAPRQGQFSIYGRDRGTIATTLNANGSTASYTIDPDGTGTAARFNSPFDVAVDFSGTLLKTPKFFSDKDGKLTSQEFGTFLNGLLGGTGTAVSTWITRFYLSSTAGKAFIRG